MKTKGALHLTKIADGYQMLMYEWESGGDTHAVSVGVTGLMSLREVADQLRELSIHLERAAEA